MDPKAKADTVDLSNNDRGLMFNPDEDAKAAGWGTEDPMSASQNSMMARRCAKACWKT